MLHSPLVKWLRIGQFVLAIAIYLFYSLAPSDQLSLNAPDKSLHFIGNVLLYLSAWVALFGRFRLLLLIVLLVPYSLAIELFQQFSPGRSVDPQDMVANMSGLVVGFLLAFGLQKLLAQLKLATL